MNYIKILLFIIVNIGLNFASLIREKRANVTSGGENVTDATGVVSIFSKENTSITFKSKWKWKCIEK